MTVDLQGIVSNAVEASMKDLRFAFVNDVTAELKAAVKRLIFGQRVACRCYSNIFSNTDRLISDLHHNKDLLETSADEIVVVRETLGEITDAVNYNDGEFTKKIKANADSLSVIKASICATNALVTESLKVGE